jgi:CRP/FNR family transcriptional regulator
MQAELISLHAAGSNNAGTRNVDSNGNWASVKLPELMALLDTHASEPVADTGVTFSVRRIKPGETLCRAGDEFEALYVVRSGFLKMVSLDPVGNEQVLSFPMRGDVIGLSSLEPGHYTADAIALDSCHIVVVPFDRIANLSRSVPGIERLLYTTFSRELARRQRVIRLLGMLSAEARVAAFLLDMSERFAQLGCSRSSFVLRMTREEIGSYLGIKLETVSRTLSALASAGLITVDRREVTLKDTAGLRSILEQRAEPGWGRRQRRPSVERSTSTAVIRRQAAAALIAA